MAIANTVLYLPPLWLHRVEALQPGIAVNVWSLDARLERAETIFGLPVPFDEDWSVAERAHALGPFISGLIRNFTDESPRKWLDSYLPQRFAPQEVRRGRGGDLGRPQTCCERRTLKVLGCFMAVYCFLSFLSLTAGSSWELEQRHVAQRAVSLLRYGNGAFGRRYSCAH